jgi:hypothetical protein
VGKLKGKDYLKHLDVDRRIQLGEYSRDKAETFCRLIWVRINGN